MLHNKSGCKNSADYKPTKSQIKEDEEEIASDLDMHSLIIGSVEQQMNNKADIVSADQVIEEIEHLISNGMVNSITMNETNENKPNNNKMDSLLSLNASTLLDALQSWQLNISQSNNYGRLSADDEETEFHSLPANLNNSFNSIDVSFNSDFNESMFPVQKLNVSQNEATVFDVGDKEIRKNVQQKAKSDNIDNDLCKKLSQLNIVQLNELYMELEQIIQIRSEILIQELALRDELEFEKELKNKFISLLLSVQNKRRIFTSKCVSNKNRRSFNRKSNRIIRRNSNDSIRPTVGNQSTGLMARALDLTSLGASIKESLFFSTQSTPVYLTTVIPYTATMNPLDVPTLQILIKRMFSL